MEWPDADAPAPVVFAADADTDADADADADGANIVRHDTVALSVGESTKAMRASGGRRLAAVIAAAAAVGHGGVHRAGANPGDGHRRPPWRHGTRHHHRVRPPRRSLVMPPSGRKLAARQLTELRSMSRAVARPQPALNRLEST